MCVCVCVCDFHKTCKKANEVKTMSTSKKIVQLTIPKFDGHCDIWLVKVETFFKARSYEFWWKKAFPHQQLDQNQAVRFKRELLRRPNSRI